jgi:hypothetical protein
MKYSSRFFLYAPFGLLVGLAIGVSVHWFSAANALSRYLDAANGHQIAPGVHFSFAKKQMAGFPFRLDVIADDLRIEAPGAHGPVQWRSEHFAMHMLDYGRVQAIFEAAGKQTLTWTDDNGKKQGLEFLPALLRASAIESGGKLSRFDLELIGAASPALSAANVQFHMRRDPDMDALDVAFNVDEIHLAPEFKSAFGPLISRIRLDAKIQTASALGDLLSGSRDWRAVAENWRKHSGVLDIDQLDVAWGKTDVLASGTLMLDSAHRTTGILGLEIAGYQTLAAEVARRGAVTGADKGLFSSLMDSAAQNSGASADRLPLQLGFKDGIAYIGQMPAGFVSALY